PCVLPFPAPPAWAPRSAPVTAPTLDGERPPGDGLTVGTPSLGWAGLPAPREVGDSTRYGCPGVPVPAACATGVRPWPAPPAAGLTVIVLAGGAGGPTSRPRPATLPEEAGSGFTPRASPARGGIDPALLPS